MNKYILISLLIAFASISFADNVVGGDDQPWQEGEEIENGEGGDTPETEEPDKDSKEDKDSEEDKEDKDDDGYIHVDPSHGQGEIGQIFPPDPETEEPEIKDPEKDDPVTIINHQYIEQAEDDTYYDLQGRKVTMPLSGHVYIYKGKKYLRK